MRKSSNPWIRQRFFRYYTRNTVHKIKMMVDLFELIKILKICASKIPLRKQRDKQQAGGMFATHASDKGTVSRIHKEHYTSTVRQMAS